MKKIYIISLYFSTIGILMLLLVYWQYITTPNKKIESNILKNEFEINQLKSEIDFEEQLILRKFDIDSLSYQDSIFNSVYSKELKEGILYLNDKRELVFDLSEDNKYLHERSIKLRYTILILLILGIGLTMIGIQLFIYKRIRERKDRFEVISAREEIEKLLNYLNEGSFGGSKFHRYGKRKAMEININKIIKLQEKIEQFSTNFKYPIDEKVLNKMESLNLICADIIPDSEDETIKIGDSEWDNLTKLMVALRSIKNDLNKILAEES